MVKSQESKKRKKSPFTDSKHQHTLCIFYGSNLTIEILWTVLLCNRP